MGYARPRHGGKVLSLRGAGFALVTPGGGANLKATTWTEIIAALPIAVRAFDVVMFGAPTGTWHLIDVGVGAVGAEVVIVPNLQYQTFNDFAAEARFYRVPYPLAAGQRVAMRSQASTAAVPTVRCGIMAQAGNPLDAVGTQRAMTYGANLATSQGTLIDPGGTINVKGAWTQLVAATLYPIRRLALAIVPPSNVVFASWSVDIGVGAAGAEVVLVPDIPFGAADIGKSIGPQVADYQVNVPAGTRLAVRAQCESNNATGRLFHAVLTAMG